MSSKPKIKLNEDKELVARIKEGLKLRVDIVHAEFREQKNINVCVRNSANR